MCSALPISILRIYKKVVLVVTEGLLKQKIICHDKALDHIINLISDHRNIKKSLRKKYKLKRQNDRIDQLQNCWHDQRTIQSVKVHSEVKEKSIVMASLVKSKRFW